MRRALELARESGGIQDSMGWVLHKRGKTREALPYLRKAYGTSESDPDIPVHLVELLWTTGDKKEAERVLDKGLKHFPEYARLLQWKAKLQR